jgi:D-tyrosyl-tRNA(Tyr) deacylase
MRALIQRVSNASVTVEDQVIGSIERGILILLGITNGDSEKEAQYLVDKIVNLRIFPRENQEFDASVIDIQGHVLIVSQFTLYGSCEKGRRPDFGNAAKPDIAKPLYEKTVEMLKKTGLKVEQGQFGAMMHVSLTNEGPATFLIEKTAS